MSELKLNIRALAAMKKINIRELAEGAGINPNHLKDVSTGKVKMSADDITKLSNFTNIPVENIYIN